MILLTLFLAGCASPDVSTPKPESPGESALKEIVPNPLGYNLYQENCARCHGMGGHGNPMMFQGRAVHFDEAGWQAMYSDEAIQDIIRNGKGMMPDFGSTFSPEELNALVRYIRSLPSTSSG